MPRDSIGLIGLFHHRWTVPALAQMSGSGGARVAELSHALGASRGGLVQALHWLVNARLIERNPGHGHPLRPEYLVTVTGVPVATAAAEIVALARRWSIEPHVYRKWPLPVAHSLGGGARFSELRMRLPGITDRALSEALRCLSTSRLAERVVRPAYPPRVEYLPTARATKLLSPLDRLADAA